MAEKPSLLELTGRLKSKAQQGKIAKVQAESEHLESIDEYLGHLEKMFSSDTLDAAELRLWLDSSAIVLGKNLSKEQIGTPEGQSIAIGLENLTDIDREIVECNDALRESAELAGVSVDALLADESNELAQQIAALRAEKIDEVRALRGALQAYGVGLVRTMQESNQKKKSMTQDELATWKEKFAAPEAMPTDYKSFAVKMQQDFIAAKQKTAKESAMWARELVEPTERDTAVREFVWGDYGKYIVEILDKELPGKENEEKRKSLLAGLLNAGGSELIEFDGGIRNVMLMEDSLVKALPEGVAADIARHATIAQFLGTIRFPGVYPNYADSNDSNSVARRYQGAYANCLSLLEAVGDKPSWKFTSGGILRRYIHGKEGNGRGEEIGREQAKKEIALANQVDAVVKFLYNGLDKATKSKIHGGSGLGYESLSPVRKVQHGYPNAVVSAISAEVTPDGVFYSSLSEPEESRVSMEQATKDARAFEQGLANALNKGKLSHDWVAESPSDVAARNASRIGAAEQQALAAVDGNAKSVETARALEGAKTEIIALQEQLRAATTSNAETAAQLAQSMRELSEARGTIETIGTQKSVLASRNEELKGEKKSATERAKNAEEQSAAILEELRAALAKPGFLGNGLKDAVASILEHQKK